MGPTGQPFPPLLTKAASDTSVSGLNITEHMHSGIFGPFYPKSCLRGSKNTPKQHFPAQKFDFQALLISPGDNFWWVNGSNRPPWIYPVTFPALFNPFGAGAAMAQ